MWLKDDKWIICTFSHGRIYYKVCCVKGAKMNTYTLRLENANERVLNIFKNLAEELGAKLKIDKAKNKGKFYKIEETQMFKDFKQWQKDNPQEALNLQKEIEEELKGSMNGN